jgi:CheY-like chemotaxis protein
MLSLIDGTKIVRAINGKEAVDAFAERLNRPCNCENKIFKLVFIDVEMPEIDGIEATKQIFSMLREYRKRKLAIEYKKWGLDETDIP